MKLKKLILSMSLLPLLGGFFVYASSKSRVSEKVDAADRPTYSGLYERIEDASEVKPGTSVILATTGGYVFDGIGGNPAYAHASPGSVTMFGSYDDSLEDYEQDNTKFLYLHNKAAVVLNVEQGASGYDSSYVSFKGNFIMNGDSYNHYFGENDEESYYGRHDYDSIERFLDGFGIRPTKDGKSTWELTYVTAEKKMLMRKVSVEDDTSFLCYSYNYHGAREHFNFGPRDASHLNLYRKVEDSNIKRANEYTPSVETDPTKLTYVKGDRIEYDGLSVKFKIYNTIKETYSDDYTLKYDGNTSIFFSTPITVYENTDVYVKIFNLIQYVFQIEISDDASHYRYMKQNSLSPDYRGTYLLSTENSRVLDASRSTGSTTNYSSLDSTIFENGYIEVNTVKLDESIIRIVRTEIGGSWYYHAMNYRGEYLCIGSTKPSESYDEYYLDYTDSATAQNAVTLTTTSFKIGDYYLADGESHTKLICFTKNQFFPMTLFKLSSSTDSVESQVDDFIDFFISETRVCQKADEEHEEKITDEFWENIETEFNKLSCDAQGIFASATYTHNTESEKTVANVADRYDYIVSKYDKADFMLRKLAGTYESNALSNKANTPTTFNNENTITMIVIVSALSVTSISLLLVIHKKKHRVCK